jgi:3-oxoacyl-(acyl-carrier-protein) synthase
LVQSGAIRLGIIVCTMAGSVTYSRRFYEEALLNPATASPLLFPETVFNAPASHLAAFLNSPGINYTLVGDEGTFLQGLALAAGWLTDGLADACVVVGAEEQDWIVADAVRLFQKSAVHTGGAGALYLKCQSTARAVLSTITDAFPFTKLQNRAAAVRRMRHQLGTGTPGELLCDSEQSQAVQPDWPGWRLSPKAILGEAFNASAAWQCVLACDQIQAGRVPAASVSIVGANQQAIGARFIQSPISPV